MEHHDDSHKSGSVDVSQRSPPTTRMLFSSIFSRTIGHMKIIMGALESS